MAAANMLCVYVARGQLDLQCFRYIEYHSAQIASNSGFIKGLVKLLYFPFLLGTISKHSGWLFSTIFVEEQQSLLCTPSRK